jgi:PhnB protein
MSTVVPYLCVKDAARAVDFYGKAFGAAETPGRITDSTGRIGHTEITIGDTKMYVADEHPEHGFRSPQGLGGAHVLFVVTVPDVDAAVRRAVAAGGTLTRPIEDQFYGDRTGEITDPFGYRWTLSTHVKDVSAEEMQRGAAAREQQRRATHSRASPNYS